MPTNAAVFSARICTLLEQKNRQRLASDSAIFLRLFPRFDTKALRLLAETDSPKNQHKSDDSQPKNYPAFLHHQPQLIKNMPIIKKKTNPANTYAVVFPLLYLYCFSLSSVASLARTRIACVATTTNATARNTKNKPYQYIRRRPAEPRKHQASAAQCHQPPIYEWCL